MMKIWLTFVCLICSHNLCGSDTIIPQDTKDMPKIEELNISNPPPAPPKETPPVITISNVLDQEIYGAGL